MGLGEALRRFGHPTVIGEIFAGVLLGPSILGTLAPQVGGVISRPANSASGKPRLVGECILFVRRRNGSQLATLIQERRVVSFTSLIGIAVPFCVGSF